MSLERLEARAVLDSAGLPLPMGPFLAGLDKLVVDTTSFHSSRILVGMRPGADSSGAGAVTLSIGPEMVVSGPFQNCSGSPANNAAVTTFGHASSYAGLSTPQALVYHKNAFALVMADAVLPRGLWVAERISNAKLGISIRMLKDHDVISDESPARLDTFHGWSAIRQEMACRVCS